MALKLQGNLLVDAPRDRVWGLLFDVEVIKQMAGKVPGITVERLVQVSEDLYEGTAVIGVAMIKGKYDGTIRVLERRAPEYVKLRAEGKGGGNWTNGDMALTLAQEGDKTRLSYDGSGNVSGPLASLGQRLIDTVGKHFVAHGTRALADELAARSNAKGKTG